MSHSSRRLTLVVLSLLLLVFPGATSAQNFPAESPSPEKLDPAKEKKAFDLLQSISEQVSSLHSPSNRVRAECLIADLLWVRDEKRSRALFKSASDDVAAVVADIDFSDPEVYQQLQWLNQLRQAMVNHMAQHDPDAAMAFLRATRLPGSSDQRAKWYAETETNLELQLAALIAKQNPQRTLELARATLPRGVSYGLIGLLNDLQRKDPKLAQSLYKEMVDQVKSEDLERNQELANAAWNLVWFQPPQANEDIYRDLLGTLINSALTITPADQSSISMAQNIYGQLQSLMPLVEKYVPARASALRQWSQNAERTFDPNSRMYQELNKVTQNGTVEDVLALASRYSGELQTEIYQQAAWKAFSSGDVNRARQIISDFIPDPVQRRQLLANFDNQSLETAISEDKIAEARQLLGRVKALGQRVQILTRLVNSLVAKGDKKGALDLLNESRTAIDAAPPSPDQMLAQLQLARAYSALDPDQSFALVQPLIAKMNELIAAAALLNGFEATYLNDGEWIVPGMNNLGNVVGNLNQTLALLARLDFDRTRSLADQIQRPELRLTADLEIARGMLGGKAFNLQMGGVRRMAMIN
jgi:regulator of sigma D